MTGACELLDVQLCVHTEGQYEVLAYENEHDDT
jgi:hypothetical protein